jgi:hypothetical protein
MKKFFLGLALFLGGQIGLAGWLVASTSIFQRGGVSSVMSALRAGSGVTIIVFYILMSLVGLVLSIHEIIKDTPPKK